MNIRCCGRTWIPSWDLGVIQTQKKNPCFEELNQKANQWGLGMSHSAIGMKLCSVCCSSQHEQTKATQLWGTAGKGTENKRELDGFKHIWNHCVFSSTVSGFGFCFSRRQCGLAPDGSQTLTQPPARKGGKNKGKKQGACGLRSLTTYCCRQNKLNLGKTDLSLINTYVFTDPGIRKQTNKQKETNIYILWGNTFPSPFSTASLHAPLLCPLVLTTGNAQSLRRGNERCQEEMEFTVSVWWLHSASPSSSHFPAPPWALHGL